MDGAQLCGDAGEGGGACGGIAQVDAAQRQQAVLGFRIKGRRGPVQQCHAGAAAAQQCAERTAQDAETAGHDNIFSLKLGRHGQVLEKDDGIARSRMR